MARRRVTTWMSLTSPAQRAGAKGKGAAKPPFSLCGIRSQSPAGGAPHYFPTRALPPRPGLEWGVLWRYAAACRVRPNLRSAGAMRRAQPTAPPGSCYAQRASCTLRLGASAPQKPQEALPGPEALPPCPAARRPALPALAPLARASASRAPAAGRRARAQASSGRLRSNSQLTPHLRFLYAARTMQPSPATPPLLRLPADGPARPEPDRTLTLIDRMIDWRLINPAGRWAQAACVLNATPTTLYRLAQTDLFRQRYAQRRQRIEDGVIEALAEQQKNVDSLFNQALDRVQSELEDGRATADFALRAFDSAARMLGFDPRSGTALRAPQAAVQIQQANIIMQGTLADARRAMAARRAADGADGPPDEGRRSGPHLASVQAAS